MPNSSILTYTKPVSIHGSPAVQSQTRIKGLINNGMTWPGQQLETKRREQPVQSKTSRAHMRELDWRSTLVDNETAHEGRKLSVLFH